MTSEDHPVGHVRVVFHVDDEARWPVALRNFPNLRADSPDASVRVVANGSAVAAFKAEEAEIQPFVEAARDGLRFELCGNALRANDIDLSQLPAFVTVVPAGVLTLALAQHEGYAYIKP